MLTGWKTILFNVIAAIIPVLQATDLTTVLPPDWLPYYGIAVAVGNVVLRHVTTGQVGYKKK